MEPLYPKLFYIADYAVCVDLHLALVNCTLMHHLKLDEMKKESEVCLLPCWQSERGVRSVDSVNVPCSVKQVITENPG